MKVRTFLVKWRNHGNCSVSREELCFWLCKCAEVDLPPPVHHVCCNCIIRYVYTFYKKLCTLCETWSPRQACVYPSMTGQKLSPNWATLLAELFGIHTLWYTGSLLWLKQGYRILNWTWSGNKDLFNREIDTGEG